MNSILLGYLTNNRGLSITLLIVTSGLILILTNLPQTYQTVVIGTNGKYMKWDDCLYRKVRVAEENQTSCYECSIDQKRPPINISITDWLQEFIDCTEYCEYPTICTKDKYYSMADTPPVERPLCYQCESRKTEVMWFDSIYHNELCPYDCKRCAEMVDLSDAVKCAPICKGYPTFCYPITYYIGEKICYQAKFWYGCDYVPVNYNATHNGSADDDGVKLTKECENCALQTKGPEDAPNCAYACSWYPTYHDGSDFLQCRPHALILDKNNDLFLFNVPNEIMKYLHLSNLNSLYPDAVLDKVQYLEGHIARELIEKFDIARFNKPLTTKYRLRLSYHEALEVMPVP